MLHFKYFTLDRFTEEHYSIALLLGKFSEGLDGSTCIALRIAMPHDGLQGISRTTVMKTILGTGAQLAQATAPERSRTSPACADIIFHVKAVLHEIGVRPDGLPRITRHVFIGKHQVRVLDVVFSRSP